MIPGYPFGYDLTLLDTKYCWSKKKEDGTWSEDKIVILYKDNVTGEKKIHVEKNPTYTFYKTDDDVAVDNNLFFIEEEKVTPVEVPYSNVLKEIAKETGNTEFFYDNIKSGNKYANNVLHTVKEIFNSDMHIEDHYRFKFDKFYKNDVIPITKAYLDIEVDTEYMSGEFPEYGECPINAVSYIDVAHRQIHFFGLDCEEYTGIEELKEGLRTGKTFKELTDFIRNHMGFEKSKKVEFKENKSDNAKEANFSFEKYLNSFLANTKKVSKFDTFKINEFEFVFHFYRFEDELKLIKDLFTIINTYRPDFVMSWNMPFDIPQIVERVKALGADPRDILCDQTIPPEDRYVEYWIDERNRQAPAQRGDMFNIAGYVIYLDQLVEFASRRKGQSAFDNMKLDNIGSIIAGVRKLDMYQHAKTFAEFPRKAYKWFSFYNIMDTIVQYCIEEKVGDIDFIYNKCLINNTRYCKGHRQTVYLTNRGIKEFYNEGYIMGNNCNRNNPKPPKFPGALIGDPRNNNDFAKVKLFGVPINICHNLDDYDFKSLYPSTMREFNIAPNTQIGKVEIANKVHDKENPFDYNKYSRGGQFLEDYQCGSYIEFCQRWFHLAGYMEFIEDMKEYFAMKGSIGFIDEYDNNVNNLVRRTNVDNLSIPLVERSRVGYSITLATRKKHKIDTTDLLEQIKNTAQMDIYDYEAIKRRRENMEEEDKEFEDKYREFEPVNSEEVAV